MDQLSSQAVSRIKSAIYSFKNSFLFYPILLSAGSIVLFAITSRIDEALGQVSTVNIPILDSLLFAGSPLGARSILSTIAAGWATIMGVAFSVTLISLQLSITKHTSEVMDEFENDKLNQIMLGWFVSTVIYSLLVLKTVRTGEDEITQIFTPVIGVNVAVFLAIIALFIFISFLHNVSKYLKPPLLINKIQRHVVKAIDKYGERQIDRNASFIGEGSSRRKLFEIKSPMQGVLRRINLEYLRQHAVDYKNLQQIWIEFRISQGEYTRKGSAVATVYILNRNDKQQSTTKEGDLSRLENSVINAMDISRNRDLLTDPGYGVEILRNIAIKSINQSDINSIKSCVSGLFEILAHAFRVGENQTKPVTLVSANNTTEIGVVVHLNERPILKTILTELATIYRACLQNPITPSAIVVNQYEKEYQLAALDLLDSNRANEFAVLTEWFANIVVLRKQQEEPSSFENSGGKKPHSDSEEAILNGFRKRLAENYPYAVEVFDIYTKRNFISEV